MRATFPLACPPHLPIYFYRSCVYMKKTLQKHSPQQFCYQEEPTENKAVPNLTLSLAFETLSTLLMGPRIKRNRLSFQGKKKSLISH